MAQTKRQIVLDLISTRDMTTTEIIKATGYSVHSAAKLVKALDDLGLICRVEIVRREDQRGHIRQCMLYSVDMTRAQPLLRVEPVPEDSELGRKKARRLQRLSEKARRVNTGPIVALALARRRPLELAWAGAGA